MPTYADLATEAVYRAEYEPPALAAFNHRLRVHYGHSKAQTTSRGDNRHLTGRHRSRAWVTTSHFCTNRGYGTHDGRDTRGPADALRATDVGVQVLQLREVSTRVDAAVRAGLLPELAEWFGTVDGRTVVGWFDGHASSSDSSHLYHLHLGYWTEHTDNAPFFDRLFNIITGVKPTIAPEDDMLMLARDPKTGQHWLCDGMRRRPIADADIVHLKYLGANGAISLWTGTPGEAPGSIWQGVGDLMGLPAADAPTVDIEALADAIVARLPMGQTPPTAQQIADAVVDEQAERLTN